MMPMSLELVSCPIFKVYNWEDLLISRFGLMVTNKLTMAAYMYKYTFFMVTKKKKKSC